MESPTRNIENKGDPKSVTGDIGETRELILSTKYNFKFDKEGSKSNISQKDSDSSPDKFSQADMESRMAATSFRKNFSINKEVKAGNTEYI